MEKSQRRLRNRAATEKDAGKNFESADDPCVGHEHTGIESPE
ncbi:hypothetical protein CES86_5271 [Brucella lupini]|uniref:Uncharacterized protein n=1 Tax=Brucella lupini TaxID=255457 RepID=A0A256G9R8_9HYPH|nr:hypothetical protein CES86_5271 [Brucella lupini]